MQTNDSIHREEQLEPRVRRVVADALGVRPSELTPEASLADDLAADSLDLLEVTLAIEGELGIDLEEHLVDDVRSYRELVGAVASCVRPVAAGGVTAPVPPVTVRVRLDRARPDRHGTAVHGGCLDPYLAEIVTENALSAGDGSRLQVAVDDRASDDELDEVARLFTWLRDRGLRVRVVRQRQAGDALAP